MKKIIIAASAVILVGGGIFYYLSSRPAHESGDQAVLEKTLSISREYVALRYRTDNILINAESYTDYEAWNAEMTNINQKWKDLEKDAAVLEKSAGEMAEEKMSLSLIPKVLAYNTQEVSDVFDKAPAGKKIATLAKHLGVDAKHAYAILTQAQNQTQADVWNSEGDTYETLENTAIVVKDGCKVAGFVGTIALTGGTSAIAASGVLAKTAVLVSGADLALEVTGDGAKIALGNNNKISAIVGDVRTVTEPAAAILMVSALPNNLALGIDKLNAVAFGADQLNSAIQSGTVIGIKLPTPTKDSPEQSVEVSVLEKEEVKKWMSEQGASENPETVAEVENVLKLNETGTQASSGEQKKSGETAVQKADQASEVKSENAKEETQTDASQAKAARIPIAVFNELDEKEKFKTMALIRNYFGEPDHSLTNESGRIVYVYLDRIEYESGNSGGVRFTFYTLDDYKKIAESAFGWDEDYQDIWDASGGGITASTEKRSTDSFKNAYGL